MAHSPLDSDIFGGLFGDPVIGDLMSEASFIRAMMTVEGHLAKVQGELGIIPQESASAIFKASSEITIDPSDLGAGTQKDGIPVPAFVGVFRRKMEAPEHARYVHWGATSQDIMDTGLILRLREVLDHIDAQCLALLDGFAGQADAHGRLPMAARTRNQVATTTSFGARVASWGSPFLRHVERLAQTRVRLEVVSFAGASGTLAALEGRGLEVADALADSLGLGRQLTPWHSARDTIAEVAHVLAGLAGSLGKFGEDVISLGQSELREVSLSASGGSSTMPHKSNPVGPETILALSKVAGAQAGLVGAAMIHKGERDGGAWALEWHALPQLLGAVGGALRHSVDLAVEMTPNPERMMASIDATGGLMFAEAATFALAKVMPRPDAQALVKQACGDAVQQGRHLKDVLEPQADIDWDAVFAVDQQMGDAARFADRFVSAVAETKK